MTKDNQRKERGNKGGNRRRNIRRQFLQMLGFGLGGYVAGQAFPVARAVPLIKG